ncbi:MAG: hypothetical protein J6Y90_01330 [Lachnospiraceae bacterium]|nr:hypothetical protein [Lachnospiraceae bacterium]
MKNKHLSSCAMSYRIGSGLWISKATIAYIDLHGGGPTELHTYEHNHLSSLPRARPASG